MGRKRADTFVEKAIGWSIGALGFLAVAYFAWYRIPGHLWRWTTEARWHWFPASFAYLILFLAPIMTIIGAGSLLAADGTNARRRLWWGRVGWVGTLAIGLLILWAFMPRPVSWVGWQWWLWAAVLVGVAIVSAVGWMALTIHEVDINAKRSRQSYEPEWTFNHGDKHSPPALGIAMSGGGIRSAAFNIGVLQALHEKQILPAVDAMSAVSGGSYAMSWYLLQPFYAAEAAAREHAEFKLDDIIDEMFRPEGRFQAYLCREPRIVDYTDLTIGAWFDGTFFQPLRAFAATIGQYGQYNSVGATRAGYRERIQELFQGMPSSESSSEIANRIDPLLWQKLNLDSSNFSCVTPVRYQELAAFALKNRLPFFIFNGAALVERRYRNMLWPTAFEWTADDLGSDVCRYRTWDDLKYLDVAEEPDARTSPGFAKGYAYLLTHRKEPHRNRWIFMVNLAPAISGAAIGLSYFDPAKQQRKMKLATWTPFAGNLDLGYLFSRAIWNGKGALYVSDGGHCENLGAYALIKRRCRRIIIVDAEHEQTIPYVFAGYSKLKERLEEEEELILTVSKIDSYLEAARGERKPTGPPPAVMTGTVKARGLDPNAVLISLIYIKLVIDRERLESYPSGVSGYATTNARFPQDPTSDQTFSSEQFAAYRELGRYSAANLDEILKVGYVDGEGAKRR